MYSIMYSSFQNVLGAQGNMRQDYVLPERTERKSLFDAWRKHIASQRGQNNLCFTGENSVVMTLLLRRSTQETRNELQ